MKIKILYTVLLVLAIFTFSCTNEPIFYNIAQEVPLLDSVVKGNVYSIVEQGEYLYAANGKIFRKGILFATILTVIFTICKVLNLKLT